MLSVKYILFIIWLFSLSIKIYSQTPFNENASKEIDRLIKKDQYDLVCFKLDHENINFKRLSKYPLHYDLLIKLDSASALYGKGKYPEAKKSVLLTLKKIQDSKDNLSLSHYESLKYIALSKLFYTEKELGNISQGLHYLVNLSEDMSPKYEKKNSLYFAIAYIETGNYKKGMDLLNLRLNEIHTDINSLIYSNALKEQEIALTYTTKGNAFLKWHKDIGEDQFLDSAQYHYDKAHQITKKSTPYSPYSESSLAHQYAHIALLKKQYKQSLSLLNTCEKDTALMRKSNSRESVWIGKAEAYTFLKKPESTFYYINKIYNEKNVTKQAYENKLKIYHLLSINYENLGDHKKAYQYAKLGLSEMKTKKLQDASVNTILGTYEQQHIHSKSNKIIEEHKTRTFIASTLLVILAFGTIFYAVYQNEKESF